MAFYIVTSKQTVYEQAKVEASSEAEAIEKAFINCSKLDWDFFDASDFEFYELLLVCVKM